MALAFESALSSNKSFAEDAASVLDYVYTYSMAQQGPRANVSSPEYGLVAWGVSK
jgi:hypothetical protein